MEQCKVKRVAVLQPNYIPWKGYFDIIHDVDLFIFYDEVQYTKNDWRNRNKIKSHNGALWLTIPVQYNHGCLIRDIEINNKYWAIKHWKSIEQYYSKAPYFTNYKQYFYETYIEKHWGILTELNQYLIMKIAKEFLHMKTEFSSSSHYELTGDKNERLLKLLRAVDATTYITGPAAREYLDEAKFNEAGINVEYKDYNGYPEYSQFFPPFLHEVSIIDLLFHTGEDAPYYIWGWRS